MLRLRNILTVYFLLYESQLAGGAIRRESYGVEVLLSHLLQKLQTARLAAASVSWSTRAFLCHFHHEKRADDASLRRFSLRVSSQLTTACSKRYSTTNGTILRSGLSTILFFFFLSYYRGKFMHTTKDTRETKVTGVTNRRLDDSELPRVS